MKPLTQWLTLGAFLASVVSSYALVEVDFNNTDNYVDLEIEGNQAYEYFANEMTEFLAKVADKELPPDSTLSITFTQIDLAGAYEPWRGPDYQDIRIYKSIYPPRLEFSYQLVADDGQVLKEGTAKLSDLTYLSNRNPIRAETDILYHEKELLRDWIRNKLSKI